IKLRSFGRALHSLRTISPKGTSPAPILGSKKFYGERLEERDMDTKRVNGSGNGHGSANAGNAANEWRVKVGLAEMLKGGVIMDVTNAEQAKIAEKAGACAVMALERVPSDIRKEGGVARMASIKVIREIMDTVTIPVMAKVRIGHFAEAEVLQALEVDFIDE